MTASPSASTIGDRLKTGNTSLAGIDADIGAPSDSAAASDTAAASLIALTKRVAQNITALNTGATAAGSNIIGRVGIDQTTPRTTNAVVATGNVAAGATDSGNSVKIGAVFNATLPTYSTGQRGDAQLDTTGNLRVLTAQAQTTGTDVISNTTLGFQSAAGTPGTVLLPSSANYVFNGTSWDRAKKPSAVTRLISTTASTNANLVKSSRGDLSNVVAWNPTGSVKYLKLYNKASAPTVGTDTPFMKIPVLATSQLNLTFPNDGLAFQTGIVFAITAGGADTDATAIAAGDVVALNIVYQ